MHIPDGMLEARTWVPAWLGSAGALAWALRRVRRSMGDSTIVMMAVMSALIFALQMLNFPVLGGTSGHFAGGAAAAIVLGLWPAVVVMAAVVTIQAVLFADGGITALGANMLTMAVVGPLVGAGIYRLIARPDSSRTTRVVTSFAAAWAACVASASAAGMLLWLSGRAPLLAAVGTMGFWHALIGIGEGAITAGLIGYLLAVRPDLVGSTATLHDTHGLKKAAIGLGVLAIVAAGASAVASAYPDGLERAYEQIGRPFAAREIVSSPFAGYLLPGVDNDALAGALAGVVGVIVVGALVYGVVSSARSRNPGKGDR